LEKSIDISFTQWLLGQDSVKTKVIFSQVSTREMGKIKTPWMIFLKTRSSTIHANSGSIVEQKRKYNG
jgi:hypothetical protein